MTWWRWVLVALVVAALLLGGGYHGGVTAERQRGAQRTIALLAAQGELDRAHADTVAKLEAGIVARDTLLRKETARAKSAVGEAGAAGRLAVLLRTDLLVASTAIDSLAVYPPLVDALSRQVVAQETAIEGYRGALAASQQRAALLQQRIDVDSAFIVQQSRTIARLITVVPVTKSAGGLGRTVETGAIALATAEACRQSPFSLGCVAGLLVTGWRAR